MTFVVSFPGAEGVTGAVGAVEGPDQSAERTFDGVVCLIWHSVSLSDGDITSTDWNDLAIRLKFEKDLFNCSVGRLKAKSELGM